MAFEGPILICQLLPPSVAAEGYSMEYDPQGALW